MSEKMIIQYEEEGRILRYIDLNEIVAGNLNGLEPHEVPEALARASRAVLNLTPLLQAATPPPADRILSVEQAIASYPVTRRWLFQHDSLPFIKRLSRKKMAITESGLVRYLGGRRR
jgi:hypothetical protein